MRRVAFSLVVALLVAGEAAAETWCRECEAHHTNGRTASAIMGDANGMLSDCESLEADASYLNYDYGLRDRYVAIEAQVNDCLDHHEGHISAADELRIQELLSEADSSIEEVHHLWFDIWRHAYDRYVVGCYNMVDYVDGWVSMEYLCYGDYRVWCTDMSSVYSEWYDCQVAYLLLEFEVEDAENALSEVEGIMGDCPEYEPTT